MKLAQPVELALDPASFWDVTFDAGDDPRWHFKAHLPKTATVARDVPPPPSFDAPLARLALVQCGAAEIEVFGYELPREVDPADFLDVWLENQGVVVVSARDLATDGGAAGDAVGTWRAGDRDWAGRHYALKWGERMFLLCMRAPAEEYAKHADAFYTTMATFSALDVTGSILAEDTRVVRGETPTPWSVNLPCSWVAQPDTRAEELCAFRASMIPLGKSPRELLFGKMVFGAATPKLWRSPSGPIETFVDALEDKGVTVEPAELVETDAPKGFSAAHALVAPGVLDKGVFRGVPCEVRARVLDRKDRRFFAMTFAPARAVGAIAWMQAKRTLDVLVHTLDLDAPADQGAAAHEHHDHDH